MIIWFYTVIHTTYLLVLLINNNHIRCLIEIYKIIFKSIFFHYKLILTVKWTDVSVSELNIYCYPFWKLLRNY